MAVDKSRFDLVRIQNEFVRAILMGSRPILGIFVALVIGGVLILVQGKNPIVAYSALLEGAFGGVWSLASTAVRATPLLLGGLAFAVALQVGVFNVGIEGQLLIGAVTTTMVGIIDLPIPPFLHLLLALLAGALGGAAYALIPALLRAYRGTSEIVSTLMMNYVALNIVSYMVTRGGPLYKPDAHFPRSEDIVSAAWLPILADRTSLHGGFILGLVIVIVLFFVIKFTPFGFKMRMIGANIEASKYAHLNVDRRMLVAFLLSGAIAGLVGASEVLGLRHALFRGFSGGLGYDGMAVGLLGSGNPIGVTLAALFFGALRAGAGLMQQSTGIQTAMAKVIEALAVLSVIGVGFGQLKLYAKRRSKNQPAKENNSSGLGSEEGSSDV